MKTGDITIPRNKGDRRSLTLSAEVATTRVQLFLWSAYFLASPFYIFPSGLPQPSDLLLVLCMAASLMRPSLRWSTRLSGTAGAVLCLAGYILVVNMTWAIRESSLEIAKNSLFYFFNASVFMLTISLHARAGTRFFLWTFWAVASSVTTQAILSVLVIDISKFRQPLFFNNPNQLGYYAVLSLSLLSLSFTGGRKQGLARTTVYAASIYLAALSLSKAALAALVLFLAPLLRRRPLALVTAAVILGGSLLYMNERAPIIFNLSQRVMGAADERDDNLASRGYDRILNHPQYLIFGAGEGLPTRFDSAMDGEIHSTFATLLFSYGIFGVGIFCWLQLKLISGGPFEYLCLMPPFLYGLTHNGLRDTFLWVSFGLVAIHGLHPKHVRESSKSE